MNLTPSQLAVNGKGSFRGNVGQAPKSPLHEIVLNAETGRPYAIRNNLRPAPHISSELEGSELGDLVPIGHNLQDWWDESGITQVLIDTMPSVGITSETEAENLTCCVSSRTLRSDLTLTYRSNFYRFFRPNASNGSRITNSPKERTVCGYSPPR
ncbi:GPI transamidase component GAA1 [Fusarium oxysporum f. sp. albedinis]|nr:GPI transamidase component GAA1 [Fusarium oxysporum f. sp. albedinis]